MTGLKDNSFIGQLAAVQVSIILHKVVLDPMHTRVDRTTFSTDNAVMGKSEQCSDLST